MEYMENTWALTDGVAAVRAYDGQLVRSGDIIYVEVDAQDAVPMKRALEIHWVLVRIAALTREADGGVDAESDTDVEETDHNADDDETLVDSEEDDLNHDRMLMTQMRGGQMVNSAGWWVDDSLSNAVSITHEGIDDDDTDDDYLDDDYLDDDDSDDDDSDYEDSNYEDSDDDDSDDDGTDGESDEDEDSMDVYGDGCFIEEDIDDNRVAMDGGW